MAGRSDTAKRLREAALRRPGVEEGVACAGTKLESRTFKVGGKAFLFLGGEHARLKLGPSQGEAKKLAAAQPARYQIGAGGWARITLDGEGPAPAAALLARWVEESHRLFAATRPKKR